MDHSIPNLINDTTLSREYSYLNDSCYLDHTGAALYAKSQVEAIAKDLSENLYSNPHSNSLPSRLCGDTVDQVRYRILQHFNTTSSDYSVIFTSGATEALKIAAETFDFTGKAFLLQNETINNQDSNVSCGEFAYLQDNHTSVLGMRSVDNITQNGVPIRCVTQSEAFQTLANVPTVQPSHAVSISKINHEDASEPTTQGNSLFVFPAQCNFSGLKYPLSWIQRVQDGALEKNLKSRRCKWFCFLDAATYVSTNPLDLSSVQPDFICISFYKMLGLPTGLGALLVRNTSMSVLHKRYYGGGTVEVALSSRPTHVLRPVLHQRFEDGTINFLSIISLRHGLDWLQQAGLSMHRVSSHCYQLARYVYGRLHTLHHSNGCPAACLYSDTAYDDPTTQGGIVNFNMCRDDGQFVGYVEVLTLANLHGIHLRTGCFCNPGACQRHLGITDEQYYKNFEAGHVCGDDKDLIDGCPTGSVRVSFGPYSSQADASRLIEMLTECFVSKPPIYKEPDEWKATEEVRKKGFEHISEKQVAVTLNGHHQSQINNKPCYNGAKDVIAKLNGFMFQEIDLQSQKISGGQMVLSRVCLYPVKSCGSLSVTRWPLDPRGLLYDRCWMIITKSGVALTQKQEPRMCLIRPVVDLNQGTLTLTYSGYPSCSIPLHTSKPSVSQAWLCQSKVCGDNVCGVDCGSPVADWLASVLHRDGLRLIRQSDAVQRSSKKKEQDGTGTFLALSNQAQFLLVNENSVNWLTEKLPEDSDCPKINMVDRFRGNLILRGDCPAFEEQKWKEVTIGSVSFKVDGPCGRCQMICIDQTTGIRTKEPLTTLAANSKGSMKFGIYLSQKNLEEGVFVSVGDQIVPEIS